MSNRLEDMIGTDVKLTSFSFMESDKEEIPEEIKIRQDEDTVLVSIGGKAIQFYKSTIQPLIGALEYMDRNK